MTIPASWRGMILEMIRNSRLCPKQMSRRRRLDIQDMKDLAMKHVKKSQRSLAMGKGYKRRGGPRFMQLFHRMVKSHAWHALTPLERCGYLELAALYDSTNNGRLHMSARRLASLIPCNKDTAAKVLTKLEDAGFVETVKLGEFTRKAEERLASEYRLTEFRCNATGELPTRKYNPKLLWSPSDEVRRPKRRALTDAERQRRCRSRKRHEGHDKRPTKPDSLCDRVQKCHCYCGENG
jgi:hypothetical protein